MFLCMRCFLIRTYRSIVRPSFLTTATELNLTHITKPPIHAIQSYTIINLRRWISSYQTLLSSLFFISSPATSSRPPVSSSPAGLIQSHTFRRWRHPQYIGFREGGVCHIEARRRSTQCSRRQPFNLTSHMTLFLDQDAVILGVNDEKYWTLMPPLPSYGYGIEHPGPRYGSLIRGQNLRDVVITGYNGTIDGQGERWWKRYRQKLHNYTRGPLVQIVYSSDIVISNVTLRNPPFWTLHPYDCKNVTIRNMTILAPLFEAPNTDGIDPDSCEDMVIEDSYISVGDDAIAIKSGWDQYGIAYGKPSKDILIRNLMVRSMVSAGLSIGSEMSGGISNVTVENVLVWNSRRVIRIKTAAVRGAYIRDIKYNNLTLENVRVGIVIKTDYNEHPDSGFDPKAFPVISNISYNNVHGEGVRVPVRIHGSADIPVRNVTFKDMSVGTTYKKKHIFQCSYVSGRVIGSIFPKPCGNLDLYDEHGTLVKKSVSESASDIDYDI